MIVLWQFCLIHDGKVKGQPHFFVKMRKNIIFSVLCHTLTFAFFLFFPDLRQYMWIKIACEWLKRSYFTPWFQKGSYFMVLSSTYKAISEKVILYRFSRMASVSVWHGYGYDHCTKTANNKLILAVYFSCLTYWQCPKAFGRVIFFNLIKKKLHTVWENLKISILLVCDISAKSYSVTS